MVVIINVHVGICDVHDAVVMASVAAVSGTRVASCNNGAHIADVLLRLSADDHVVSAHTRRWRPWLAEIDDHGRWTGGGSRWQFKTSTTISASRPRRPLCWRLAGVGGAMHAGRVWIVLLHDGMVVVFVGRIVGGNVFYVRGV